MAETEQVRASLTMAFPSPILRIPVVEASRLKTVLIEEAHALRNRSDGMQRSNQRGWHSENDLMMREEPGLSELARIIKKAINTATKAISPDFVFADHRLIAEGWININPQHGYNVPHRHNGHMWSGSYYVTVPPVAEGPSGCIEFLSPHHVPGEFSAFGAECFKDRVTMRPREGDMLLFPSYLTHWVYPNEADQERMTIAFNGSYLPRQTAN